MKIDLFQKIMLSYLNIPYVFGGKNPLQGEDCSGLVCEFLKLLGKLSTNEELGSQQLYTRFKSQHRPDGLDTGSLIFYGLDEDHIDHVAMFLDDHFIVEAGHGTADTLTKDIAAQRGAFTRVRPHDYRSDGIAIINLDLGLVP